MRTASAVSAAAANPSDAPKTPYDAFVEANNALVSARKQDPQAPLSPTHAAQLDDLEQQAEALLATHPHQRGAIHCYLGSTKQACGHMQAGEDLLFDAFEHKTSTPDALVALGLRLGREICRAGRPLKGVTHMIDKVCSPDERLDARRALALGCAGSATGVHMGIHHAFDALDHEAYTKRRPAEFSEVVERLLEPARSRQERQRTAANLTSLPQEQQMPMLELLQEAEQYDRMQCSQGYSWRAALRQSFWIGLGLSGFVATAAGIVVGMHVWHQGMAWGMLLPFMNQMAFVAACLSVSVGVVLVGGTLAMHAWHKYAPYGGTA